MKSSVTNRKQRFWALLLAVVMVVGLLPTAGVKAADISTTALGTDDASIVGKIISAGELITNTDTGASISVEYRDINDVQSAWYTSSAIVPNASHTVLSYDAVVTAVATAAGTATPDLAAAHRTDKWEVITSSSASGSLGTVYLKPVPKYIINWDDNDGDPRENTIKFKDNSALTTKNQFVKGDDEISLVPSNFSDTRKGYTFTGWKVGTTVVGSADNKTETLGDSTVEKIDGYDASAAVGATYDYTITLVAQWQSDTYTVNYNANAPEGEALVSPAPEIVAYDASLIVGTNDSVTLPASPTDAAGDGPKHYNFNKWSVDITGTPTPPLHDTWDSVSVPTLLNEQYGTADYGATIDIRANWTPKLYDINLNLQDPSGAPTPAITPIPAVDASQIGLPYDTGNVNVVDSTDANDEYAFMGWSFSASGTTPDITPNPSLPVNTLVAMAEAYEAANPTVTVIYSSGNEQVKLYGIWMRKYSLSYDGNGADGGATATQREAAGTTVSVNSCGFTRTGYTFSHWETAAGKTAPVSYNPGASYIINADETLYAQWTINNYNVTFDVQGIGTAPAGQTVAYNGVVTEPAAAPSATGYTFGGWYKEAACTNAWNFRTDKVTAATTLYAKWTAIPYPVTFDVQGKGTAPAVQNVDYNTLATEPTPAPTETGYTFGGWYKEKACTNAWNFTTDKVTAATTLYAKWTAIPYAVTFDVQGKGTAPAVQNVDYNTLATEPTSAPTETGYTFGGWYKEKACTNAWNFTTDKVTAATTLYAKWTVNNYNVSFDVQGKGTAPAGQTVAYNGTVTAPAPAPTAAGYTFGGWYKEAACTNAWNFTTDKITAATTLYAKWTATAPTGGGSSVPVTTSPSPTPAIVTPTASPTPAVVTPTATPTPDPNGDGGNGGQGTPVEEKIYDIKYFEVDDDGNEIELKNTGNPKTYKYGEGAVIDKKLDREGYVFLGWFTKDGTKPVTKISKKAKGTKKLYARYEAVPEDDGTGDGNDNINGNPSDFSTLFVRLTNYTENSMTLTWEAMEYIDGYDIFGSRCNSKDVIRPYEPIASVGADVTEYVMSDLLAKTYYKFYIRAYILVNNEKRYITTSINVHGVTLNDTYGVADEINIDKVVTKTGKKSRTKYNRAKDGDVEEINITMKVGQTLTIVTSEYNADGKEIRAHRPISFESSNPNICKVGKKNSHKYGVAVTGKANTYKSRTITAKAAGGCTIWVFAQNGIYTKVNVKVKPAD